MAKYSMKAGTSRLPAGHGTSYWLYGWIVPKKHPFMKPKKKLFYDYKELLTFESQSQYDVIGTFRKQRRR